MAVLRWHIFHYSRLTLVRKLKLQTRLVVSILSVSRTQITRFKNMKMTSVLIQICSTNYIALNRSPDSVVINEYHQDGNNGFQQSRTTKMRISHSSTK